MENDREQQFKNADRIKLIRKEMRMTQDDFCELIGIPVTSSTQGNYSRIERGFMPLKQVHLTNAEKHFKAYVINRKVELKMEIARLDNLLII